MTPTERRQLRLLAAACALLGAVVFALGIRDAELSLLAAGAILVGVSVLYKLRPIERKARA